jgi:hypothetical protein
MPHRRYLDLGQSKDITLQIDASRKLLERLALAYFYFPVHVAVASKIDM